MSVDHGVLHPNGSVAHSNWAQDRTLHVAVAYCNPFRYRTRLHLFNDFRRHISSMPNVKLYVGELAYGERPFEATSANHPLDFQWRVNDVLWHKENILNRVIQHFDKDWQYGAYIDGDFNFTRLDVALETIHMLQLHEWVQMFSTYSDLSHDHQPMRILKSFGMRFGTGELTPEILGKAAKDGYLYSVTSKRGGIGTTGGAWAFKRSALNACGGLLDTCVLGSADWHMSFGLAGEPDTHPQTAELVQCGVNYAKSIKAWQNRASIVTRKNIGYVNCHAIHHWHGSKKQRGYGTRWKILKDNDFNPYVDLYRDVNGIYQLNPDKWKLRDEIRKYFMSRNEDDISLREGDTYIAKSI